MKTASSNLHATLALVIAFFALTALAPAQEPEVTTPAAPGMLLAFVTAGTPDPAGKVPALNAVSGSKVGNLSIAFPITVFVPGKSYTYVATLQDNNYTGAYSVTYSLTHVVSGKTVIMDSGTIVSNRTSKPGQVWAWETQGKVIPKTAGTALLNAEIHYGTKTQSISTAIWIQ